MKKALLVILSGVLTLINSYWLPSIAVAASVLERTPQQVPPQVPTPKPNPNALKSTPSMSKSPVFVIGGVSPSRAGFQRCSNPAGFLGTWSSQSREFSKPDLSSVYCTKGNVTITQTNPLLISMVGQKLRLAVDVCCVPAGPPFGTVSVLHYYELPFANPNYITFQVVFAMGLNFENLALDPVPYLNNYFRNGLPLGFFVVFPDNNLSYQAHLECTFKSYPGTHNAPVGSNDPPPNRVDCP